MADAILKNKGIFDATYGDDAIVFSTNEVSTVIVNGITATKSADKTHWVNGPLTYTILVQNVSGTDLTDVVLSDYLDVDLVTFDDAFGVYIDEVLVTTYTYSAGTLIVNIPLIEEGGITKITFRVLQA